MKHLNKEVKIMTMQEFNFKDLTCSEQLTSNSEIERLLKEVQQGETVNTIKGYEAIMEANYLISLIALIVPQRFMQGVYAYRTEGDGKEHNVNEQGTRIGIVVTDDCYKMTISREPVDDSNEVKIGLDQNAKYQIEKEIVASYERQNGVKFK